MLFALLLSLFLIMALISQSMLQNLITSYEELGFSFAMDRIEAFHRFMGIFETELEKISERALLGIFREVKDKDLKKLTPGELKRMAFKYGVDDVYLIDRNGRVFATSFLPDLGLSLFSISPTLEGFLKGIFSSGRIVPGGINLALRTGETNFYAYYGPIDENYLLEVSMDVKKYLDAKYYPGAYEFLFNDFLKFPSEKMKYVSGIRIYRMNASGIYILNEGGKKVSLASNVIGQLMRGETVKIREGKILRILKRKKMGFHGNWKPIEFIEIDFNLEPLVIYRWRMMVFSISSFLLIFMVGYLLFTKLMKKYFLVKIDEIRKGLDEISKGNFSRRVEVEGEDELARIARDVNRMAEELSLSYEEMENRVRERTRELEEAKEKLEVLARTDYLTGLLNRRAILEKIHDEILRYRRSRRPFTIMIIDINDFKILNDTHGHLFGDEVLKMVGKILKNSLRAQDKVSRWGGDEFLIFLPETDARGGRVVKENLKRIISESYVEYEGVKRSITISAGFAVFGEDGEEIEEIIFLADQRLYQDKFRSK